MDKALEQSLATKAFVKGLLFADLNGLLITGNTSSPFFPSHCMTSSSCLPYSAYNRNLRCRGNCTRKLTFSSIFAAKGEINGIDAGRYSSISRQASSLHSDQSPPTVLIETNDRKIIVKDYDAMTIVLRCALPNDL